MKNKFLKFNIVTREDIPTGTIYFMSGEVPPLKRGSQRKYKGKIPNAKLISRFIKTVEPRRIDKIINID